MDLFIIISVCFIFLVCTILYSPFFAIDTLVWDGSVCYLAYYLHRNNDVVERKNSSMNE